MRLLLASLSILLVVLLSATDSHAITRPNLDTTLTAVSAQTAVVHQQGLHQRKGLLRGVKRLFKRGPEKPSKPGKGGGLAIAGLVLGIVGIFTYIFVVPSLLALIFGVISRKKYVQGYHDRGGYAKAAIILGIVGLSLMVLYLLIVFFAIVLGGW